MLRAVAFCARACVKFKSTGTVSDKMCFEINNSTYHIITQCVFHICTCMYVHTYM